MIHTCYIADQWVLPSFVQETRELAFLFDTLQRFQLQAVWPSKSVKQQNIQQPRTRRWTQELLLSEQHEQLSTCTGGRREDSHAVKQVQTWLNYGVRLCMAHGSIEYLNLCNAQVLIIVKEYNISI